MKIATFDVPALYGDHHVMDVRRMLLEIPGVEDVYASSAFHVVEIHYDPDKVKENTLEKLLNDAGYLNEMAFATEAEKPAYLQTDGTKAYFRHTEVFETSRQVLSFSQQVPYSGRPLWNCPGFGVIKKTMED